MTNFCRVHLNKSEGSGVPEGVWWETGRETQKGEGGEVPKPNFLTSQFYVGPALP